MIDHGHGCQGAPCTCGAKPAARADAIDRDTDTVALASLIAQVLSGGIITGPDNLPPEVMLTAELIKDQGWTRCTNGCCGGAS